MTTNKADDWHCDNCHDLISQAVASFSRRVYKRQLCIACQKKELDRREQGRVAAEA